MNTLQPWVRLIRCKVENKNYSTNFQSNSSVKEEIMIPDMTEDCDDEASVPSNDVNLTFESSSYIKEEIMVPHKTEYFDDEAVNVVNHTSKSSSYIKEEIMVPHKTEYVDDEASNVVNHTSKSSSYIKEEIMDPYKTEYFDDEASSVVNHTSKSYSHIKEEIMVPHKIEYFDDEAPSIVNRCLQTDQIPFEELGQNKSKLTHKEQTCNQNDTNFDEEINVVNVDKRNQESFAERHKNEGSSNEVDDFDNNKIRIDQQGAINMKVDVTSDEESLMLDITGCSDESEENFSESDAVQRTRQTAELEVNSKDKVEEYVMPDKKNCKKYEKQNSTINFCKRLSIKLNKLSPVKNNTSKSVVNKDASKTTPKAFANKGGKLDDVIRVCSTCNKKDELLNINQKKINCQDCKTPMVYECLTCGDRIFSISNVYYHKRQVCGRPKSYQCEQCSFQCKNEYRLRCHVISQHSVSVKCPKCGIKLRKKSMLKHKTRCGISEQYYKCKFCPFDTKYKVSIVKHMRKFHVSVKSQQFNDIIKKIFKEGEKIRANALNSAKYTEVNTVSSTTNYQKFIQLYCTKCEKICENSVDYKKERACLNCGTTTLLQCAKCSRRLPKIVAMLKHLRRKCLAQNRFQCADCNYESTNKMELASHIHRRHVDVAPEDYFRCSKCDRGFKYPLYLTKHEKRCKRQKLLQCKLCPYKETDKAYFNLHMQNHKRQSSKDDADIPIPGDNAQIKDIKSCDSVNMVGSSDTNDTSSESADDLDSDDNSRSDSGFKSWSRKDMKSALEVLRNKDLSLNNASVKFGIPVTTLWLKARRLGIDMPKRIGKLRTWNDETLKDALDALRNGKTVADKVAKAFGIPSSTFYKIAKKEGIKLSTSFRSTPTTWSKTELDEALKTIKSSQFTVQRASAVFSIPCSTLYRRCRMVGIQCQKKMPTT